MISSILWLKKSLKKGFFNYGQDIVMAFSSPVIGCLVKKGLQKGVTGTLGPPWLRLWLTTICRNFILLINLIFFCNANLILSIQTWILSNAYLNSFDANLETQTWFFRWKFEFSKTQTFTWIIRNTNLILSIQTWILRNVNLILSMQTWILWNANLNSQKRKLEFSETQAWILWNANLNSQKRKLEFSETQLEFSETQAWIRWNANLNSQKRKLEFSETQTWILWNANFILLMQTWHLLFPGSLF